MHNNFWSSPSPLAEGKFNNDAYTDVSFFVELSTQYSQSSTDSSLDRVPSPTFMCNRDTTITPTTKNNKKRPFASIDDGDELETEYNGSMGSASDAQEYLNSSEPCDMIKFMTKREERAMVLTNYQVKPPHNKQHKGQTYFVYHVLEDARTSSKERSEVQKIRTGNKNASINYYLIFPVVDSGQAHDITLVRKTESIKINPTQQLLYSCCSSDSVLNPKYFRCARLKFDNISGNYSIKVTCGEHLIHETTPYKFVSSHNGGHVLSSKPVSDKRRSDYRDFVVREEVNGYV